MNDRPIGDLRRRMLQDMTVRQFSEKTQHDYIRHVEELTDTEVILVSVGERREEMILRRNPFRRGPKKS